ncbi:olfactory ionotropic receptor IR4 [Penaeus vannamei]|uniref:Olfactory ionotropic receptor IR4 n=1 Tax=Penaeus vannamei TaxID=6689 RepID=A0A423T0P7_PENVA|nr:olfactory ionotropic receptor IR4 [Penaeus vannamei]
MTNRVTGAWVVIKTFSLLTGRANQRPVPMVRRVHKNRRHAVLPTLPKVVSLPSTVTPTSSSHYISHASVFLPPGFEAVNAVLRTLEEPHCSVILVNDGRTAPHVMNKFVREVAAPWGVSVFEVPVRSRGANRTNTQLSGIINEARKLRRLSWRVSVVVLSDDPAFLASFAESSLRGRLLVWATRLLVVTRLPLQELRDFQKDFSMINGTFPSLTHGSAFVALPYSPPESRVLEVARWSPQTGLVFQTELPLFPEKFFRFYGGATLVVAAEEFIPHVKVVESQVDLVEYQEPDLASNVVRQGEGGVVFSFEGPMANILDIIATSMNFSYGFVRPRDGAWGTEKVDGSWSGMVGMVSREEADLGLGPFAMTTKRAEVVDYATPILIDYARILGGRGRPEVDPWGFLFPLTQEVWMGVLVMVAVVLLVVLVLSRLSEKALQKEEEEGRVSQGTRNMYFGVFRILLQQDAKVPPGRRWERVLLAGWMIVTLVTVKSYAGNLMSLLAVRHIPQPYQSVRDVLDDPACTMIWEANTMFVEFLSNVQSGPFHEVWRAGSQGRILFKKSTEYLDAIDSLVRSRPYVLIVEDLTHRVLMGQDFSVNGFPSLHVSVIGQKGNPIVEAISKRIWAVTESGLYDHWLDSFIPNSTSCANVPSKITVNTSLGIMNLWRADHAAASGAPPHSQTHAYHDRQDVAQRRPGKRDREEVRQELHHRLQVDPTLPAGGIRRHLADSWGRTDGGDVETMDEQLGILSSGLSRGRVRARTEFRLPRPPSQQNETTGLSPLQHSNYPTQDDSLPTSRLPVTSGTMYWPAITNSYGHTIRTMAMKCSTPAKERLSLCLRDGQLPPAIQGPIL